MFQSNGFELESIETEREADDGLPTNVGQIQLPFVIIAKLNP